MEHSSSNKFIVVSISNYPNSMVNDLFQEGEVRLRMVQMAQKGLKVLIPTKKMHTQVRGRRVQKALIQAPVDQKDMKGLIQTTMEQKSLEESMEVSFY